MSMAKFIENPFSPSVLSTLHWQLSSQIPEPEGGGWYMLDRNKERVLR